MVGASLAPLLLEETSYLEEARRPMGGDGRVQEDNVVWHHGGVDSREAWQGRCVSMI